MPAFLLSMRTKYNHALRVKPMTGYANNSEGDSSLCYSVR